MDELIEALRNCACADGNGSCAKCSYKFAEFSCKWKMMRDAADAIEKLVKENERLEEELNNAHSKDKINNSFVLTGQDLFGRYAKIAYGNKRYGTVSGVQDYHIYKVIQRFRSNSYCDVPLTYQTEHNCYVHDEIVDVVNVIHCGIDECHVVRVALKDIELIPDGEI